MVIRAMDHKTPLIIVGAGAEARAILDLTHHLDVLVYGFISEEAVEGLRELNDISVISQLESEESQQLLADADIQVVMAIPDIESRRDITDFVLGLRPQLTTLIHPQAIISEHSALGQGNVIDAGCLVGPNTIIGEHNFFYPHSSIGPDVRIGDFCTIQSGVRMGKEVEIDDGVYIGMGAIIHPGVGIGAKAMIGPGAVVLQDVPEGKTAMGNPAVIK